MGWSCRDHAVVTAAFLRLDGIDARLRHGRCMFVQGESEAGPPVGVGQPSESQSGHSWNWIAGFGHFDVSPRLTERVARWRPLAAPYGIMGQTWHVDGIPADAVVCGSRSAYDNAVAWATHLRNACRAVHWVEREEDFRAELLTDAAAHIDSPQTARILKLAGQYAYVKLLAHLRGLVSAERQTLSGLPFAAAWQQIGRIPDDDANEVLQDLIRTI